MAGAAINHRRSRSWAAEPETVPSSSGQYDSKGLYPDGVYVCWTGRQNDRRSSKHRPGLEQDAAQPTPDLIRRHVLTADVALTPLPPEPDLFEGGQNHSDDSFFNPQFGFGLGECLSHASPLELDRGFDDAGYDGAVATISQLTQKADGVPRRRPRAISSRNARS